MHTLRAATLLATVSLLAACDRSPSGLADECGEGEIRLEPGQVMVLQPNGRPCPVRPAAGAEYAVVYLDARIYDNLDASPEPYWDQNSTYGVYVGDASGPGGARLAAGAAPAPASLTADQGPEPDFVMEPAGPSRNTFYERPRPWAVGDTVWTPGCVAGTSCTGEPARLYDVARVYDGWMVVAMRRDDPGAANALALMDQAYPVLRQHGVPMLGETFGTGRPKTSQGSGQLLVALGTAGTTGASSYARWHLIGDSAYTWVEMWSRDNVDIARFTSLLAHEVTHAYQIAYMHGSRSPGVAQSRAGGTRWGIEGGANLMSYELTRRAAGAPLAGNYDWRNPGQDPFTRYFAYRAQSSRGGFTSGYDGAMPFLRDLVVRRVAAGEPVGTALREVSRGAVEGWTGVDMYGSRRPGMVARMRARLGAGWEPGEALLTWALSVVGDDRTPGTLYQDPVSLRVWDVRGDEYGWHPDGVIEGGSGAMISIVRPYGSPGYTYLRDTGAGIRLTLQAYGQPEEIRWRLMRIR